MKTLVIYYSLSGNNRILAEETAKALDAEIFEIKEEKERTKGKIALDMILHRCPPIMDVPRNVSQHDLVIFVSPIWMFSLSSPLRSCIKAIKGQINRYGFLSLSGGAMGPNTKISRELLRRLGKDQAFLLDFGIARIFNSPKAEPRDTSKFQLRRGSNKLREIISTVTHYVRALEPEPGKSGVS